MPDKIAEAANKIAEAMNAYASAFIPHGHKYDEHWIAMDTVFGHCTHILEHDYHWSVERIADEILCPEA